MRCLTPGQQALAASQDEDLAEYALHLADCVACRAAVAEQRAIRALIRRAPAPPLPPSRREAIGAEVMARSDAPLPGRALRARGGVATAIVIVVAAAAAIVVAARWPAAPIARVPRVELAAAEPISLAVRGVSTELAPPVPPARVAASSAAAFTRATVADRDVLDLRSGTLTIDARDARGVEIVVRGTTVHVQHARISVVAHAGVIDSVTVFAGSAEIRAGGKLSVVEAGMVWVPETAGPAIALREFRTGWAALRASDLRAAVAAFDRARDPVVAEDAAYWAAVATERAGARGDAARRYAGFLDRFAASPHADAARSAIARLTP